ncbi:MAG: PASTA domain-containing protein [Acidobacteriaceae bacterium]
MIGFFRFILVMMLLVVVAMTSAIVTMHFAIHGAEVAIPDLRGMTVAQAGQRAASLGLTLHVENRLYSAEMPAGRVANQSPAAGTTVRRGWRVWLTESLGPQKIAIPNLLGKDQRIAAIEIRRAGLSTGTVAMMPWPDAPPGVVFAQSPEPNASGVEGPVMNLLVAAPPSEMQPPNGLVMPQLTGQGFTAAAWSIVHAGLHLAPVKDEEIHPAPVGTAGPPQPPMASGTIIAQSPAAGDRVDPSVPIQLTVAK